MAKRFEFSTALDHPVEQVHATLTDTRFWAHRFEAAPEKIVIDSSRGPGALTVTMTDTITSDALPGIVGKFVSGEMRMERIDTWDAMNGDRATGRFVGSATGIPVQIDGTFSLKPVAAGSVLEVKGSAAVKIPLVGGQIEGLVKKMVRDMVEKDRAGIDQWLREKAAQ